MSPSSQDARPILTIVVPCYNESERLDIPTFKEFLSNSTQTAICFVNDGSNDGTLSLLEHSFGDDRRVYLTELKVNSGKGEAVRAGLLQSVERSPYVGYCDADLSVSLKEMERLLTVLQENNSDVVLGSRVRMLGSTINRSFSRHLLGRFFATLTDLLHGIGAYDTQCGAKVFRVNDSLRNALSTRFHSRWCFDIELLLRLSHQPLPLSIIECPLRSWNEVAGSKLNLRGQISAVVDLVLLRMRGDRS